MSLETDVAVENGFIARAGLFLLWMFVLLWVILMVKLIDVEMQVGSALQELFYAVIADLSVIQVEGF